MEKNNNSSQTSDIVETALDEKAKDSAETKGATRKLSEEERLELKQKYTVSDENVEQITRRIFDKLTFGVVGQKNVPVMVIIGGQPGAGKTGLMTYTNKELGANTVIVDIDDFRNYHPYIDEIKKKYPDYFVDFTAKFISDVSHVITPMLIDGRYNMILHKTLGGPAVIDDTVIPALNAGYFLALRVMAVSALQSKLSALGRTQDIRDYVGMTRWVNREHHDGVYTGMLDVIDEFENKKLANVVEVFMRGETEEVPERVYANIIEPMGSTMVPVGLTDRKPYSSAREAVEQSRIIDAWNCLDNTYEKKMETIKQKAKLYSGEGDAAREQGYIEELESMVASMKTNRK